MLQVVGTAAAALASTHRYSNKQQHRQQDLGRKNYCLLLLIFGSAGPESITPICLHRVKVTTQCLWGKNFSNQSCKQAYYTMVVFFTSSRLFSLLPNRNSYIVSLPVHISEQVSLAHTGRVIRSSVRQCLKSIPKQEQGHCYREPQQSEPMIDRLTHYAQTPLSSDYQVYYQVLITICLLYTSPSPRDS